MATGRREDTYADRECFYPRHPRGWRPYSRFLVYPYCSVSIHATLAGGDNLDWLKYEQLNLFLSTPPSRVATEIIHSCAVAFSGFYPRHPRGWRRKKGHQRDAVHSFYPRHPRGWRHIYPCYITMRYDSFYPRHPRGWRRIGIRQAYADGTVSIHATLAGGDYLHSAWSFGRALRFYPRHPRGWRLLRLAVGVRLCQFLSTPPSRVATKGDFNHDLHSPCFYPRHPRGWRRWVPCRSCRFRTVSIHATLAGGDAFCSTASCTSSQFLSTPPSRVATLVGSHCNDRRSSFYPRHPRGWRHISVFVAGGKV